MIFFICFTSVLLMILAPMTVHADDSPEVKVAQAATFAGSGSSVFFGLHANEWAAVAGVAIAFLGLLANVYFKWQHLRLARELAAKEPAA